MHVSLADLHSPPAFAAPSKYTTSSSLSSHLQTVTSNTLSLYMVSNFVAADGKRTYQQTANKTDSRLTGSGSGGIAPVHIC